ncbi:unnamed protein product, partial [Ectocarpus sp. 8 AP-2014]
MPKLRCFQFSSSSQGSEQGGGLSRGEAGQSSYWWFRGGGRPWRQRRRSFDSVKGDSIPPGTRRCSRAPSVARWLLRWTPPSMPLTSLRELTRERDVRPPPKSRSMSSGVGVLIVAHAVVVRPLASRPYKAGKERAGFTPDQ